MTEDENPGRGRKLTLYSLDKTVREIETSMETRLVERESAIENRCEMVEDSMRIVSLEVEAMKRKMDEVVFPRMARVENYAEESKASNSKAHSRVELMVAIAVGFSVAALCVCLDVIF